MLIFFDGMRIIKKNLFLFFCLFLGMVLTFGNIGLLDFWLDEAGVAIAIKHSFWEIGRVSVAYSQSILYNYGVKIWSLIFGESVVVIRSFSAFCYLVLILMMYRAGSYFFQSKKIGLWAALLMATNYFAIWYAIEAKVYTLAALMGLLAYYFFVKSVRNPNFKNYLFYFLFGALGPYAHPWLILIFGSQILSVLIFRKHFKKVTLILFIQFLVFLASIPFLMMTVSQGELGINDYIGKVDFWAIFESFAYLSFGATWAYLIITAVALFLILKNKTFVRNIFKKLAGEPESEIDNVKQNMDFQQKEERTINIMLLFYLFIPLIIALVASQFKPAYLVGRYEMTVLPALLLILANLWSKIEEKIWLLAVASVLIFFVFKNILIYRENTESYKSTDKTVIRDIFSEAKNGDYIVPTDLSWATAYYYSGLMMSEKKLKLVPYPQEIAEHPVWINSKETNSENNRQKYEQEAQLLVDKIKNDPNSNQIFILYKTDSVINEMLRDKFNQNFEFVREDYPEMPREPSWFSYVIIYKK